MGFAAPAFLGRDDIERRVRLLCELRTGSNLERFFTQIANDAVFEIVGHPRHNPWAGKHVGYKGVRRLITAISTEYENLGSLVGEMKIDGQSAAFRRSVLLLHRGTGRRGRIEMADFVRFENGLVQEFVEIADTAMMSELRGAFDN